MASMETLSRELEEGRVTARELVEQSLGRIADPAGEGATAFLVVHGETARAAADYIDALRKAGRQPSRFAGIPVNWVMAKTALLSGGLAALAGVSEVLGLKGNLTLDLSPGFGYTPGQAPAAAPERVAD